MSESVQAVLALLMISGMIGGVLVFMNDRVNWPAFAVTAGITVGSLALLLWSMIRRDKVPDYLSKVGVRFFERDGFCFAPVVRSAEGRCYIDLHFQSRYSSPSRAMVVLQPSKGFFLVRPELASMTIGVNCPAGGYGITSLPWPVAKKFQGKKVSMDIGADVTYPEGRGKMIRYRGGLQVRTAGADMSKVVLTVAGALSGQIVLIKPAKMRLTLPVDVEESVDESLPISTRIEWTLSDALVVP